MLCMLWFQLMNKEAIEKCLFWFEFWLLVSEDTKFVIRFCIEGAGPSSTVSSGVRFLMLYSVGN